MSPTALAVCCSPEVGSSAGLAAALAVSVARLEEGSALLIEFSDDGATPRQPTLLASAEARSIESSLRESGEDAASRGHICSMSVEGGDTDEERLTELTAAAAPNRTVFSLGSSRVAERLESLGPMVAGCVFAIDHPAERSLAALVVSELADRGIPVKIAPSVPGPVASRRALAGIGPGGALEVWSERTARHLTAAGKRANRTYLADGDRDAW